MQRIDAVLFTQMLLQGAQNLELNRARVDALNVFPVPDGDTGTNMNLTLQSVVKAVSQVKDPTVGLLGAACATGSLMGARGNSGVILSQLFRGFGRYLEGRETITGAELIAALEAGVETVYKAVRKPVEGTILTVMRESVKAAGFVARRQSDLVVILQALIEQAEKTLAKTPDMLPVLKQAGVVDAGGQGLVFIFHGFLSAAQGKEVGAPTETATPIVTFIPAAQDQLDTADIKYAYCTEFLIKAPTTDEDELHQIMEAHGDSLMVVGDSQLLKVHIHTNNPGLALELALKYGELTGIKIENMKEQHTNLHQDADAPVPAKKVGVVSVVAGAGLEEIFRSLGVDRVVSGGQTMNPSTEDLARAAKAVNAEQILILPNNKNIIMAAEQVQELLDRPVYVLPSRTLPQGLAALMSYNPEATDVKGMLLNMDRNMRQVRTGQVTVAVRDHSCDAGDIKEGNFIGIKEGEIAVFGQDLPNVAIGLAERMVDEDSGLISIFYGEEVMEEAAQALADQMGELFPDLEIELRSGGQPVYHYIISVE